MTAGLRYEVRHTLGAPVDAVWLVLGDFGTEHRWTKSVSRCVRDSEIVRVGTRRTCTLPKPLMGRTQVTEEITEYAPRVALSYMLDGPAGPFTTAASKWSIAPASVNSTVLTVEGNFTPRNWLSEFIVWPLAKPFLQRLTRRVIGELEHFLVAVPGS